MKLKELPKKHPWVKTIFWIVITAIISISIERSCGKIIPEEPMVVKEITDTVRIMHSYDFGDINDSLANIQLKRKLENIELAQRYEAEIIKKDKLRGHANSIKLDASFPNMKGYYLRGATSFFSYEMSSLDEQMIEFKLSFFDDLILNDIYCLILKIYKIENNQRIYYEEQCYNVNGVNNLIRIANSLPKGKFEFCVGFILKRDRLSEYPNTYQVSKIATKTI
ncbi:MAG: hypothetical protein E7147_06820 [Rikenellaceae bacterium]|nr:hypothetical protein [Rikenellaceae bacterium]